MEQQHAGQLGAGGNKEETEYIGTKTVLKKRRAEKGVKEGIKIQNRDRVFVIKLWAL